MRWHSKSYLVAAVCLATLFLVFSLGLRGPSLATKRPASDWRREDGQRVKEIACLINGASRVPCLRDSADEVYVPFQGLIKGYFEISGSIQKDQDGSEVFEWWHSSKKTPQPPPNKYDPTGAFGQFASYNVDVRDRVRCLSGAAGVPMSVQWGPKPYFYPIQISQFALEHYSKKLTSSSEVVVSYPAESWRVPPDFEKESVVQKIPGKDSSAEPILHIKTNSNLENPGVFMQLDQRPLHVIQTELKFADNGSFSVVLERLDTRTFVTIHYVQSDVCVAVLTKNSFLYGIGSVARGQWKKFTRNLLTDLANAVAFERGPKSGKARKGKSKLKLGPEQLRLTSFSVRGDAMVGFVSQRDSAHLDQFLEAADWLWKNQDQSGGWPVPVRRSLADGRLELDPGWQSAMGQGHALSVLTRAFILTHDQSYINSAQLATRLFSVNASEGGVRNYFLDKYPWYEEYPTTPGSFVLNGFIYSLLGLYDLASLSKDSEASVLLAEGLRSLKTLLPLFDTGSGTVYDLRHVTLGVAPNRARWDYHAVHIYQLLWLHSITDDHFFKVTAERWMKYAQGYRAQHN